MSSCVRCGSGTEANAKFCVNCGGPQKKDVVEVVGIGGLPKQGPEKPFNTWAFVVFSGMLVVAFFMFVFTRNQTSAPAVETSTSSLRNESPIDLLKRDVTVNDHCHKEADGIVLICDFAITNPTPYSFKDFTVQCKAQAQSGTQVDSNERVIYQRIAAASKKRISGFNMGFLNTQTRAVRCEISNFILD